MIVNRDYKCWHIAYYCYNSIIETPNYSNYTYCVILDDNKYIEEVVLGLNIRINFVSNINKLPLADIYIICCYLDERDYDKVNLHDQKIINVYQMYLLYEKSKIPSNYIVDEYRENNKNYYEDYIHQKDALAAGYIQYYIRNCFYANGKIKLFNKIEIETINRCNNVCSFCPANRNSDKRQLKIMEDDVFKNIIHQLSKLQYEGAVGLFSNNEPLLDPKLIDRCAQARKYLPNAYLYIYTNGILLNEFLLCQLLEYLDYIYIDNYNVSKELIDSLKPIHKYLIENNINPNKVSIHLRNQTEILSTRAGKAPNKNVPVDIKSSCLLPFSQMIIQSDGKVCLCSNDATGQVILGDTTVQSLEDIWTGENYENIRTLIQQGRKTLNTCNNCDAIFTPLPFERINNE